jgi:hypothetical protein
LGKVDSREEELTKTIGLRKEGARITENWLADWKTTTNLLIPYKQN